MSDRTDGDKAVVFTTADPVSPADLVDTETEIETEKKTPKTETPSTKTKAKTAETGAPVWHLSVALGLVIALAGGLLLWLKSPELALIVAGGLVVLVGLALVVRHLAGRSATQSRAVHRGDQSQPNTRSATRQPGASRSETEGTGRRRRSRGGETDETKRRTRSRGGETSPSGRTRSRDGETNRRTRSRDGETGGRSRSRGGETSPGGRGRSRDDETGGRSRSRGGETDRRDQSRGGRPTGRGPARNLTLNNPPGPGGRPPRSHPDRLTDNVLGGPAGGLEPRPDKTKPDRVKPPSSTPTNSTTTPPEPKKPSTPGTPDRPMRLSGTIPTPTTRTEVPMTPKATSTPSKRSTPVVWPTVDHDPRPTAHVRHVRKAVKLPPIYHRGGKPQWPTVEPDRIVVPAQRDRSSAVATPDMLTQERRAAHYREAASVALQSAQVKNAQAYELVAQAAELDGIEDMQHVREGHQVAAAQAAHDAEVRTFLASVYGYLSEN